MRDQKKVYRSFRSVAVQSLIVVLVTLLLLEGAGLFFYYHKHGRIYYGEAGRVEITESQDESRDLALKTKQVLHPFLGFTFRPSLPMSRVADSKRIRKLLDGEKSEAPWTNLRTNNHGFFSEFDYPYGRKSRRELIIGIFGGSVGQWFALQGAERLKKDLQEHPFFRDRDITVLNFSQGGFKQPQQIQTLSYFLAAGQEFDLVVNVDGFNELALTHINHKKGVDTSMPSAQHLLPLLGMMGGGEVEMEMIDKLHSLRMSEHRLRRIEQWNSSTRSAGLHLFLSVLQTRAHSEYDEGLRAIDSLGRSRKRTSLVHLSNLPEDFVMSDSIGEAVDFWLGAAVAMQEICNARDIRYLEVIQPNQYFSRKEFSAEELRRAINEESPYREAIETGYQRLPDLVRRMRQEGVNVVSAVDIFDDVKQPVYSDSCCHYNQTGNEILAGKVAASIVSLVEDQRIANPEYHSESNPGS
jgi:hypothetical protein